HEGEVGAHALRGRELLALLVRGEGAVGDPLGPKPRLAPREELPVQAYPALKIRQHTASADVLVRLVYVQVGKTHGSVCTPSSGARPRRGPEVTSHGRGSPARRPCFPGGGRPPGRWSRKGCAPNRRRTGR